MTALSTLTGAVSISVGSAGPVSVASFELPVATHVERTGDRAVTLGVHVGPESLGSAIADALRQLADRIDPDVADTPVDLEGTLEPGFVVLACPDCKATVVGRPGESIEHAKDGAHVHHMSYE